MSVKLPDMRPKEPFVAIRTSDRATFKRCRRRWGFNSPLAMHLQPQVKYFGVVWPLQFGTLIHKCLEEYYDPVLKRDPLEVFRTEWNAFDREVSREAPDYRLEHAEEFKEHYELGIGMLKHYKGFAEKHDNFEVIAVEHDFYIPLGFEYKDKPVYYCGRMDMIKRDLDTGSYGLKDHKTSGRLDEEFFLKLEMDEQCTSYLWAAQREAEIYDLPYKKLNHITYNVLRKACILPPSVLKSGGLSVDRANESTTAELFEAEIQKRNLYWWFNDNPKAQAYLEWLQEVGESNFFVRENVRRNAHEIGALGARVEHEAKDMLNALSAANGKPWDMPYILYPNPTGDWYCKACPFRAPCLAMNDGSDWEGMLEDMYEPSTYGLDLEVHVGG